MFRTLGRGLRLAWSHVMGKLALFCEAKTDEGWTEELPDFPDPDSPEGISAELQEEYGFDELMVKELFAVAGGLPEGVGERHVFDALDLAGVVVLQPFRGDSDAARRCLLLLLEVDANEQTEALREIGAPLIRYLTPLHVRTAVKLLTDHPALVERYVTSQDGPFY